MKKFGKILAAAFAFAALGLASCDHDYSVSQIEKGQPSAILALENATKATYTATYTNADDEEKTAAVAVKDGKVTVDGTVVATYEVYYDGKAKILTTPASGWTVELKDDGSLKTLKKGDTTYSLESTSESSGTSGKGASVYTFTAANATAQSVTAYTEITIKSDEDSSYTATFKTNKGIDGSVQRYNMGGAVGTSGDKNYIKFTTTGAANIKASFYGNSDRYLKLLDSSGNAVGDQSSVKTASTDGKTLAEATFTTDAAGDFYLGSASGGIYITKIVIEM